MFYPRYRHGVFAKWLKSLALNTVLGGLKVFTGEINIIIVAFVFIMDELHTQEEAKRLSKGAGAVQPKGFGMLRLPRCCHGRVHRQGSGYSGLVDPSWMNQLCGHPWPHLVGGLGLWWY